jgi:tetratricopeptide (TPR) repeat protein
VLIRHAAINAEQAGLKDEAKKFYARVAEVTTGTHRVRVPPQKQEEEKLDPIEANEGRLLRKDYKDDAEHAQLLVELGDAYKEIRGDGVAALGAYEQALKLMPDHAAAIDALAEIAYKQRDWARAHYLYKQAPSATSKLRPAAHALRMAEIAEALGHEEGAFDAFRAALEFSPQDTEVLAGVARSAIRIGQLAEAFLAQQSLVELLPVDDVDGLHQARLTLASICEEMGDIDEAIRSYEQILREEPDSPTALSRVPKLYMEADRTKDAIRALRAQLRVTPSPKARADVLFNLGETYRMLSDDTELAADSYFKAIDLDPAHVGTLRRLLRYYCLIGDWESANEMSVDLEAQSELLQTATGLPLLHRATIAAALCNDERLTNTLGRSLGIGSVAEIARALREIFQSDAPPDTAELARAARAVCRATGDKFASLIKSLDDSEATDLGPLLKALRRLQG